MIKGFNVRVYALCVENNKLLVLHENYNNNKLCKLPGGGLEYGEGVIECLKRECKEELNLDIIGYQPFYIQEDFIESIADQSKQIVLLYFKVKFANSNEILLSDACIQKYQWIDIKEKSPLHLPVDLIAFQKLKQEILEKQNKNDMY